MGSLGSRPQAPSQPPPVAFTPPPVNIPPPNNVESAEASEQSQSEARAENLLQRNRGRLGTIRTGFRGLLTSTNNASGRKTLLGE